MAALGGALWRLGAGEAVAPAWASFAGAGSLLVAVAVPLAGGYTRKAPGPSAAIVAEMARTPRGSVTVVDFVDFECPFCRMTQAELGPLLEAHKDRVRVVRRQVPLRSHSHALDAARAACCAERLGKGDAMAAALFSTPVDDLTREGCEKVAQSLGVAIDPYRACVTDPKTDEQIEADRAEFKESGGYALPTIWIGERRLVGSQPREALEQALAQALARAGG
jgi:predicted DsbA family dithiol-disulfide isomerase